ncbi:MAG: Gfo/Idh/MocA family protein, partial [Gammaproteobacteria bacterium]
MTSHRASRPHGVAILGAGIGEQHMDGYLALPKQFHVEVVCDLDAIRAEAVATRAPGCKASGDIDAAIVDPRIDVIDICLPPSLHGPVAFEALAAGKHVVCEKPLATSVVEAERMVAAANSARRILMPVFQYRYGRGVHQLMALVDRGVAGPPLVATLETHWNRGADYYSTGWRGSWSGEGGGAVLSHAIHSHDLLTCLFGAVTNVSALVDTRVNPIETEDCAAIAMTTESGALVTSSITLGSAMDMTRLRFVFAGLTAESGRNPYAPGQGDWCFTARNASNQQLIDATLAELQSELAELP